MNDQSASEVGVRAPSQNFVMALLSTWTGRILIVNTIVFIVMSIQSGSIFFPGDDSLLSIGAKEPVAIVNGEYWRFITPIFIHIGIIHFAFNSYILYIVGNQLEEILGPKRFLLIFFGAGIMGNVASAVLSPIMSAGASGAIFGLLGCGFYIERAIRKRMETSGIKGGSKAYAMTILINLAFGLAMPFIDNSAHIGGLIGGYLLTLAVVHLRPNRFNQGRKGLGYAVVGILCVLLVGGIGMATNRNYVSFLLEHAAEGKKDPAEQVFFYSRLLALNPTDNDTRIIRARIFIENGESRSGYEDIRTAISNGYPKDKLLGLADDLATKGLLTESWQVKMLAGHIN